MESEGKEKWDNVVVVFKYRITCHLNEGTEHYREELNCRKGDYEVFFFFFKK